MKKHFLYVIALLISLAMSVTSCESKPTISEDHSSSASDTIVKPLEPTEEILAADVSSSKIQLGNTVVELPATLQEIIDAGGNLLTDINIETTIMQIHAGVTLEFTIDDYKYFLSFFNYTFEEENPEDRKRLLLKDCTLSDTDNSDAEKENYNIIFPGGVRHGSTVSELKKAWGDPEHEDIDTLIYNNDHMYSVITIDLETQSISTINRRYMYK